MTARNNILLIIKQQPGIEYNALLNKITGNYGSIESARAALSRSIRYLNALGLIVRKESRLFATAKGAAMLNSEMRNKLLLKLNEAVKGKEASIKIDTIVEMLHTLIERSKQDDDLLKAARGSVDFSTTELLDLSEKVSRRIHSLQYLQKTFSNDIDSLKELDFPDYRRMKWGAQAKRAIHSIAGNIKAADFVAECLNEDFFKKAAKHFAVKSQQNNLFFEQKHLLPLLDFIEKNSKLERNLINLYLGAIKIRIDYPYIFIIAPFKQLDALVGKKRAAPVV